MKDLSISLTASEVKNIVMKGLERHARNEYGQPYELASVRSVGAKLEFDELMSILIDTIDSVERLMSERVKKDA